MKNIFFNLSVLAVLAAFPAYAAAPVLDQQNPGDPAATFTFAIGGPSAQTVAQTITVGLDGRLTEFRVPVGCASGRLIAEVRDVDASSGQPGATVIATRSYRSDHFPGIVSTDLTPISFGGRVRVTAGDQLALVLSNPTGSCGILPGLAGNPYPAGSGWAMDDVNTIWVPLLLSGTDDLGFESYVRRPGGP